jgi:hypothetical protein
MTRPVKPFERKWSAEQQQAIAHAMTDARPRLKAKEASAAALAGTLPGAAGQLAPFGPVPPSTCSDIARKERLGREVKGKTRLAKAADSAHAAAIVYADAWDELDRAREDARRAKMSAAERAKTLREITLTAQTIARAERDLTGERPSKPAQSTEPNTDKAKRQRTEADDLARAARRRAQTEQQDHPTQVPTQRETVPDPHLSNAANTDHATDSRGRVQERDSSQHMASVA